jgi:hypothetical protein
MIAAIKPILIGRLLVITYALYKDQMIRMILSVFYVIPTISTLLL